jgi:hypothetical protein
MKPANKVHIQLTHVTEDGKNIRVIWVPAIYKNTREGPKLLQGGYWFPVLILDANRSDPCRMPLRLLDQRLREDKERQAKERKELDLAAILEAKRKLNEGMTIHVEG